MGFGRSWLSSDAAIVSCVSRRAGLTCKHYDGLSFWLGRSRGYRIYYDAPGFPPDVHPLFRTDSVWCGIDQAVLEDSNPILECWRPADGLELSVTHVEVRHRGRQGRREKAIGFRPSGFQRLRLGRSFVWRCTKIDSFSATHCSANSGQRVFTCHNGRAGLACRNRHGRGFWVNARAFDTF
jgi:hypothetical protein